jgi:ribokinase
MPRVAVVGHVEWVDFLVVPELPSAGEITGARLAFERAGGGGGVVASVLARMGAEVDFFCALGNDAHGHAAAEQLSRRGVRLHVAWHDHHTTRRAVTMIDPQGERTIVTTGARLEPFGSDELEWDRLASADGVYFTAGDAAALRHARAAGVVVASPRGRAALRDGPRIEALVYSGLDRDEREWAQRLADRTELLVETQGAEGGEWRGASSGRWEAVPAPGPVRDTYGCGDSFAAGFTLALSAGGSVAEAVARGAECGARALTQPGPP